MYPFVITLIIYASIAQAFTARMDGGGAPKTPEVVERLLCVLPYSILGFFINPLAGLINLASYGGVATGHGQYFPSLANKEITPEFVDPLVTLFFGKDRRTTRGLTDELRLLEMNRYGMDKLARRCSFGMFLTALLVIAAPLLTSFFFLGPLSPIPYLLLLSALGKPLVYRICHRYGVGTEGAEYANGFIRGLAQFTCIAILPSVYIMWG